MPIKLTGFDEVRKKLDRMAKNLQSLNGQHEVSFDELFTAPFMVENTNYSSFEALLEASPFKVETKEDFQAIPDEPWDEFIRGATRFGSWQEMMQAAASNYAQRRMMKGIR